MHNKKSNYSILTIFFLLCIGSIFAAIGIALLVITIDGIIKVGIVEIGIGILMPIVFVLLFLIFGSYILFLGGKKIYLIVSYNRTQKHGKDGTATIVDYRTTSFRGNVNTHKRYSFVLSYINNEQAKYFTTDYIYDINELRYLEKLKNVKIKINNNFVTICEPFPKEIYKLDSNYGIELAFYKQKPVKILLILWPIFFLITFIFLIASMIIGNSNLTEIAIIAFFVVHTPFVLVLACYLIKWIRQKK